MFYLLLLPLICSVVFLAVYVKEPRTLWLGASFVATLGVSLLCAMIYIFSIEEKLQGVGILVLGVIGFLAIVWLMSSPFILLLFLSFNGIRLIKREGLSFRNLLLIGSAVLLFVHPFISRLLLESIGDSKLLRIMYETSDLLILYLLLIVSVYTISSMLNTFYFRKTKEDYIIVLGSGLNGDQVTPLLASRINKGIQIYQKNPGSKLIMSGGKGADELIAEGEAMCRYAIQQGIKSEDILVENQSRNTRENILFSKQLIPSGASFCLVTNRYHLFRALLLAKELALPCRGYGAKTKLYFSMNAFIREIVGYLQLKKKQHLLAMLILTVGYIAIRVVMIYMLHI
ncbi:TPA: YdcF family protein [Streptococcus equi subsp. zooepidemicus]|nr:YdcF family protein [Streptococcus equi subsp. zooepidemicus]